MIIKFNKLMKQAQEKLYVPTAAEVSSATNLDCAEVIKSGDYVWTAGFDNAPIEVLSYSEGDGLVVVDLDGDESFADVFIGNYDDLFDAWDTHFSMIQ